VVGFEDAWKQMWHIFAEAVGRGWRGCKMLAEDTAGILDSASSYWRWWGGFRLRAEDLGWAFFLQCYSWTGGISGAADIGI